MRLLITSDLHYNIARSREPAERLARRLCDPAAGYTADDALVIAGDLAGAEKDRFDDCLALFDSFGGRKFFVAGNHSLWSLTGQDALEILRHDLPARGARHGFACLEYQPAILGPVALVGTVGWYDYSFRHEPLAVPMRFYQNKVAPGAARYFTEHRDLLVRQDDLLDRHHELTTRWMDGAYVRLPGSDEEFTKMLADKLARQLDEVASRVDRIVVVIHHVPLAELMPDLPSEKWQFVAAFMGSALLGRVCRAQPKVTHIVCGHTHQAAAARVGPIECAVTGSSYLEKRVVEWKL